VLTKLSPHVRRWCSLPREKQLASRLYRSLVDLVRCGKAGVAPCVIAAAIARRTRSDNRDDRVGGTTIVMAAAKASPCRELVEDDDGCGCDDRRGRRRHGCIDRGRAPVRCARHVPGTTAPARGGGRRCDRRPLLATAQPIGRRRGWPVESMSATTRWRGAPSERRCSARWAARIAPRPRRGCIEPAIDHSPGCQVVWRGSRRAGRRGFAAVVRAGVPRRRRCSRAILFPTMARGAHCPGVHAPVVSTARDDGGP